jgi:hypothetical protein
VTSTYGKTAQMAYEFQMKSGPTSDCLGRVTDHLRPICPGSNEARHRRVRSTWPKNLGTSERSFRAFGIHPANASRDEFTISAMARSSPGSHMGTNPLPRSSALHYGDPVSGTPDR